MTLPLLSDDELAAFSKVADEIEARAEESNREGLRAGFNGSFFAGEEDAFRVAAERIRREVETVRSHRSRSAPDLAAPA